MSIAEHNRRINQAIEECTAFIEKEAVRRDDLRPADVQNHLDFCIAHREKLKGMLK